MAPKSEKVEKTDRELHPELYFDGPKGHPRDRIKIHENERIPREGQFIGLNGYQYLIKPGFEVDIPRPVRLMLDTRIETITRYGDDGKEYTKDVPRITYTLIKEDVDGILAPPAEVIASTGEKSAEEVWKEK